MAFRSPENVKRYEYTYFDLQKDLVTPANNAYQAKKGYRFVADSSGLVSPFDWWNVRFVIDFKVQKKTGAAIAIGDQNGIVNDIASIIKEIQFLANGIKLYETDYVNHAVNIKHLLEYSPKYASSVGTSELYYLDRNDNAEDRTDDANIANYNKGFAMRKTRLGASDLVTATIPLNSFSFFDSLRERLIPNMKFEVIVDLEDDVNITWEARDALRYVLFKFQLWIPRIEFTATGESGFTSKYLVPKSWSYLKERIDISNNRSQKEGTFTISTGTPKPRHVFVWFLNVAKTTSSKENIFHYDTFNVVDDKKLENAKLSLDQSNFYPEIDYTPNTDLTRPFLDCLNYTYATFDPSVGSQITMENYKSLFSFLYFDLRYQKEDLLNATNSLKFIYSLDAATNADYKIYALTLFEQEIELYDTTGKLLIRNV